MNDQSPGPIHSVETTTVLHVFSGDLWAGAEVMLFTLLRGLQHDPSYSVVALGLNEGTLTSRLRTSGVETYVISEREHGLLRIAWIAFRILRSRRFDVLHSHRYKENLLAWILSKVLRADRLISTIHGMPEPQLQRTALFARVKTRLNFALLRRCFYKTIAVSREMAAALVDNHKFSPDQVEVIYNGISLPEVPFRPYRSQTETAHVGTIGRMVPVKDYALFLKAAAEIRRNHTLVRFSILGNGPLAAQLKEQAVEIGLGGSIEFLTPRPDIAAHYGILDVYVNTSQHEGVPLTVLEAMANGVPVVAASVGGIREIIVHGQSGLLVESRNPKDFAAACIRLLEDSSLRESIRRNAYQRVRRVFGEDEMARRYKAVYESVCENS